MIIVPDEARYNTISEKVKKHVRYERLKLLLFFLFVACIYVPLVVNSFLLQSQFLGFYTNGIMLGLGVVLGFAVLLLGVRKLREYDVDDNEWAIYYTYPLYINLGKCIRENTRDMKEDYRKQTLEHAWGLLSCAKNKWEVGTFKPIKEYEDGAVSTFQENLQYRIIPAIKEGDNKLLEKVETIIYNLLAMADTLKIEEIKKLNQRISIEPAQGGLSLEKPSSIGYSSKFLGFVRARKKHVAIIAAIGTSCLVFLIGLVIWGISKESAVNDTLVFLGILMTVYVAAQFAGKR